LAAVEVVARAFVLHLEPLLLVAQAVAVVALLI
jgi:hypothetical protein